MDEGCDIIVSTWKQWHESESGIECIPIMHIYNEDKHVRREVGMFLKDTFKDIGADVDGVGGESGRGESGNQDLILYGLKGRLSTCGNLIK